MAEKGLVETMSTLRAVREFTDRPISHALMRQLMELATKASNDRNLQDWRFIVVRDPDMRKKMGQVYLDGLLNYHKSIGREASNAAQVLALADLPQMQRDSLNMARQMVEGKVPPVYVAACYHQTSGLDPGMSLYPAIQNLTLAAWSFGIGSVLTTSTRRNEKAIRQVLGLPADVVFVALIPMGYPARRYGPPRRKPVEEVTFGDRWGTPFKEP